MVYVTVVLKWVYKELIQTAACLSELTKTCSVRARTIHICRTVNSHKFEFHELAVLTVLVISYACLLNSYITVTCDYSYGGVYFVGGN